MIDNAVHPANVENVEAVLRAELARGDALAASVQPVLRHLLTAQDGALFSDEILARVRGMLGDLAGALLETPGGLPAQGSEEHEALVLALMDQRALLGHVHALALEWRLTEWLQARMALDPVVSPLLQSLVSSENEGMQALAMTWLAAQARWCQAQRRMGLPFTELPGELLHGALQALRIALSGTTDAGARIAATEAAVRLRYEEGASRLGLAAQLVMGLGNHVDDALAIDYGGLALFLTALALRSGLGRDALVLSTHEAQAARLALALRAAGLSAAEVTRQMLVFHPGQILPEVFDEIGGDMAAIILATGRLGG
ncbi:hypothetical protein EDF56_101894 [Novosphingobium sp. PhB165]|uniref:hypothetical protein n=1 Tax=Novosphingobium sp. PhB165 TaxID=2485105 RepID=UPI00104896AF|nr:hypothetical protein [Novosphingobium sp. PhB165]TCM22211.1 hypothetical protein EDF56_101894 [Novosphingobium sp. PhB165]